MNVWRYVSNNGDARITDGSLSFESAWWPNESDFQTQLLSAYGALSGRRKLSMNFTPKRRRGDVVYRAETAALPSSPFLGIEGGAVFLCHRNGIRDPHRRAYEV